MPILETTNLGIQFGGLKAVDGLDLRIEKGQLYGLIGPNGAGKTTVFNMLTGVYQPTSGSFVFDGEEIKNASPVKINKMGIARTFQNIRLFSNMSVIDNVRVGFHDSVRYSFFEGVTRTGRFLRREKELKEKSMELLKVFGIDSLADAAQFASQVCGIDGEYKLLSSNLPYGKQRKLEIARALATKPKLLLLDEPAAGMNPNETAELMDTIRLVRDKFDMTILLIEHDMKLVGGICEEVTVLNFGTVLAQGKTSDVLNDPKVITAYIGEDN